MIHELTATLPGMIRVVSARKKSALNAAKSSFMWVLCAGLKLEKVTIKLHFARGMAIKVTLHHAVDLRYSFNSSPLLNSYAYR
jgi:hypothetical protein